MHKALWQYILSDVSSKVSKNVLDTWFRPLVVKDQNDHLRLVVCAPNIVVCDFVEQHYKRLIYSLTKKHVPKINAVEFVVAEDEDPKRTFLFENKRAMDMPSQPGSVRPFVFNRNFTFDSFVVGPGNEFAKSAAFAVARAPGKTKFNPLLIYAGAGLGKTHLLHAIGNYLSVNAPDCKVVYTSSEEFYLNFIDAIKNNNTKLFSDSFKTARLLLIDDVHFFSGKESTQEEFFYIFNALYQNERQIVLTTDVPPAQLMGLQDRLVSRFQWGLCVDIQSPNLETRIAILKRKAEEGNLNIAENILSFIAENFSSNIRELEGIIIRLLAFASITKQDITINLVKNIILEKNKKKSPKISIEEIINTVAEYYKVPVNNIREKNRRKEVAFCRQCAMYMVKLFTNYSLKSIGLHFGGRDHSTVIHALQTIEKLMSSDPSISSDIEHITSILKNI